MVPTLLPWSIYLYTGLACLFNVNEQARAVYLDGYSMVILLDHGFPASAELETI